ncbi:hypothetical protein ABZP36_027035 [Zizania latifolia]
MEGKSRVPEITVVPAASGGAVDAVKEATKEPISPGSPSPAAAGRAKESRPEPAVSLPAWKLDALCQESGMLPAMRARFPYF